MVTATIEGNALKLELSPLHKALALKGSLEFPLECIDHVERAPEIARAGPKGMRSSGTSIPYLLKAGSFKSETERTFWDVRNANNAISIWLKSNMLMDSDDAYDQIIVEVANPVETVALIERALADRI